MNLEKAKSCRHCNSSKRFTTPSPPLDPALIYYIDARVETATETLGPAATVGRSIAVGGRDSLPAVAVATGGEVEDQESAGEAEEVRVAGAVAESLAAPEGEAVRQTVTAGAQSQHQTVPHQEGTPSHASAQSRAGQDRTHPPQPQAKSTAGESVIVAGT
jgi:hypothetical protein